MSTKPVLPPLPFGSLRSDLDTDLVSMRERIAAITNWVSEFDTLSTGIAFQHRTSVFVEDQFRLMSVSSSPTVMKVNDPSCMIAIPLYGALHSRIGKTELAVSSPRQALFYPSGRRHTEGGLKSTLLVSVTERRMLSTARVMLGEEKLRKFDIHTPRLLDTRRGPVDFLKIIDQACVLIDQFNGNRELLKNFSPDEQIVRAFVMMLAPESFFSEGAGNSSLAKSKDTTIRLLCEYLVANMEQPINLTVIESLTGLSARVLQQEFKKRFGLSPMQWLREQRLARARQILNAPTSATTVSHTAALSGFDNFSDFASRYRIRFGELPSETLKKAQES